MSKKRLLALGTAILVLAAGATAIVLWKSRVKDLALEKPKVTQIDRHLSEEDRKFYEDRLAATQKQIKDAPKIQAPEDKSGLYATLGDMYSGLGRLVEARDAYLQAIAAYEGKVPEQNLGIYTSLFNVYVEMQNYQNAKLTMEKAIELDSTNPDFWRQYISLQKTNLNASEAGLDALYHMALKATQNQPEILGMYSTFLDGIGDKARAISYLQKAIKENPDGKAVYEQEIARIKAK